ncbi:MAG: hypothetical protein EOP52_01005 [Sphingobacteriales bacterium]|nr:MAG: hypothetical protein EOP52_01005 [Sphingobacteriales bacterium]
MPATLQAFAAPVQLLNVNADSGGRYQLARGTQLIIPQGAFRNLNGDTTHGTVQITFAEYLDRSEMIYSNILTDNVDTNETISINANSAGAFYIQAAQNGFGINIRPEVGVGVYLPQRNLIAANQPGISLAGYYGVKNDKPIGIVDWTPSSRPNLTYSVAFDTVAYGFDTLGYHQAAQPFNFFGGTDTVRFSVGGANGITEQNSFVYLLPKGMRSVIDMGSAPRLRNRFFMVQNLVDVHLVSVAVVNGRFYGGITSTKLENRKSYSVNLQETDPAAFKTAILNLP